ncbi:class I SAM-dependent methyltransferase [candidate division CSSED10-310 bacterium]|uniref:Class I SAM-dependent methyltransferase n=1 Tax=candidate division CSSED10-310 bacterium TaxID=2855610 RepID=A0ABV6YVH2_UNCC1
MLDPEQYWELAFRGLDPETYDFSTMRPDQNLEDYCSQYLAPGASILDLGCGGGRNSQYLAQHGFKVWGIDISHAAIELCSKRFAFSNLSGDFQQGIFNRIPFDNHSFDGLICIAALDHVTVDIARETLTEIRRVVVHEGTALITFDPPETDEDILDEAEILADGTLKFVRGNQDGMLFHRYQDDEIKLLIGEHRIISFTNSQSGGRIVICR